MQIFIKKRALFLCCINDQAWIQSMQLYKTNQKIDCYLLDNDRSKFQLKLVLLRLAFNHSNSETSFLIA